MGDGVSEGIHLGGKSKSDSPVSDIFSVSLAVKVNTIDTFVSESLSFFESRGSGGDSENSSTVGEDLTFRV